MTSPSDLDDVDLALGGLAETAAGRAGISLPDPMELGAHHITEVADPATAPPPRPATGKPAAASIVTPESYDGRRSFDDLFRPAPSAKPPRGGLEEKIEFLRSQLKHAGAKAARFREAWTVREAELDAVETLLTRERQRVAALEKKLKEVESFFENKKQELAAYGDRVAKTFAEKDAEARQLTCEVGELRDSSSHRDVKIAELEEAVLLLQAAVDPSAERADDLRELIDRKDREIHRLTLALRAAVAQKR